MRTFPVQDSVHIKKAHCPEEAQTNLKNTFDIRKHDREALSENYTYLKPMLKLFCSHDSVRFFMLKI
jgi:hypothetical protein